jgi:tape measure domain-containing protein
MAQFPIDIKIDTSDASKLGPLNRQLNETDKSATAAATASRALGAAIATIATGAGISQLVKLSDSYTKIQNSIVNVVSSTQELTQRTGELLRVANQSRSSFEATAALYGKLKRATDELGISQDRVLRITDLINKGFVSSGATVTEASNAMIQLAQGLASGTLRGDEFNSVAEQAPVILRAVSQETGKTIGQLREFAAQGGITADILIKSIEGYAATIDREFARTATTFDQQLTVARNLSTEWVGTSDNIRKASAAAGATLVTLAENLDTAADAATALAAIYASRLVGQLIAKQAATVAANAATLESIKAEQLAAGAAVRRAEVEKIAAMQALAAKREKLAATIAATQNTRATALETESIARLIPVLNAQTRAQGSVAVATAAAARTTETLNVANARLTAANTAAAATGALATATRGLSAAMALLGGPAGVAILAGSALLYFADSAAEAGQKTRDSKVNDELERLVKNYGEMGRLRQRGFVEDLTKQQISLNDQLIESNRLLEEAKRKADDANSSRGQSFVGGDVTASAELAAAQARVNDLKLALESTKKQLDALFQSRAPDADKWLKPPEADETLKFYDELKLKLEQQIALIGLTEVEQARLQARQELLNKSTKEGVKLTEAQIKAYTDLAAQAVVEQQRAEADKYILSLGRQVAAEKEVGLQAQVNANLARLSAGATAEQRAAVEALTQSLYAQQEAERAITEANAVREFGNAEETPAQKLEREIQERKDLLFNAYYEELIGQEEYNQRVVNLDKELATKRAAAQSASNSAMRQAAAQGLDALAGIIEAGGGKSSKAYRAVFAASRAFALADSIAKLAQAQAQALADPTAVTLPQKIANYAAIATAGAGLLTSLKAPANFADGGYVSGPGTGRSDSIPAMLSNGEYVMPAQRTDQYRNELDAMRRGTYGGTQSGSSGMRVTINNNAADVADVTVAEGPDGELIATIDRRINERVPGVMAEQATDSYSKFNRSMNNAYRLERR